ncbi:MAG TPA: hypothetical protein GXZ98_07415 [Firmicutes bacterium]|jgi:hypothetical protein|nr:hypothetical protein [Bacillota bacterium]
MRARNFGLLLLLLSFVILLRHQDLVAHGWLRYSPLLPVAGGILFLLDFGDTREKVSLCLGLLLIILGGLFGLALYH